MTPCFILIKQYNKSNYSSKNHNMLWGRDSNMFTLTKIIIHYGEGLKYVHSSKNHNILWGGLLTQINSLKQESRTIGNG